MATSSPGGGLPPEETGPFAGLIQSIRKGFSTPKGRQDPLITVYSEPAPTSEPRETPLLQQLTPSVVSNYHEEQASSTTRSESKKTTDPNYTSTQSIQSSKASKSRDPDGATIADLKVTERKFASTFARTYNEIIGHNSDEHSSDTARRLEPPEVYHTPRGMNTPVPFQSSGRSIDPTPSVIAIEPETTTIVSGLPTALQSTPSENSSLSQEAWTDYLSSKTFKKFQALPAETQDSIIQDANALSTSNAVKRKVIDFIEYLIQQKSPDNDSTSSKSSGSSATIPPDYGESMKNISSVLQILVNDRGGKKSDALGAYEDKLVMSSKHEIFPDIP